MKKIILIILSFGFFSLDSFASDYKVEIQLSEESFQSQEITEFEIANTDGKYVDISFPVSHKNKESFHFITTHIKDENGFSCKVHSVYVDSKNDETTVYRMLVDWEPGADLSGCYLTIGTSHDSTAKVYLYMNYGS